MSIDNHLDSTLYRDVLNNQQGEYISMDDYLDPTLC